MRVWTELDQGSYPTKLRITEEELSAVRFALPAFHGEWNHTSTPRMEASET